MLSFLRPVIIALLLVIAGVVIAADGTRAGDNAQQSAAPVVAAGATPVPAPAKGKGDKCVAPTDWMRRNHMTMLRHQRDSTVHEGERAGQFSLKGCMDCHAVAGAGGIAVTIESPQHFCRSCHDYAAVAIDCFECHASRPAGPAKSASGPGSSEDVAALEHYVKGLRP